MSTLGHLKSSREGHRTNVKRLLTRLDTISDNAAAQLPQRAELTTLLHKLNMYQIQLRQLHDDILPQITDTDEIDAEVISHVDFEERVLDAQGKSHGMMADILTAHAQTTSQPILPVPNTPPNPPTTGLTAADMRVRLPKLDLPKFGGDPLDWQPFWDSFASTIHSSTLSNIDKLKYLMGSLTGEAAGLVGGFRVVDANYDQVVESLKERFGDKEVAIFLHLEQFLALPASNNETQGLQYTFDQCERHIRSLVALGLEESTFGVVFVVFILSKLPRFMRVDLHKRKGAETWKLPTLRDLLRDELKARQMGDLQITRKTKGQIGTNSIESHSSWQSGQYNQHNRFDKRTQNSSKSKPATTSTFVHQKKQSTGNIKCIFCNRDHYSNKCTEVTSYDQRKQAVSREKRCFKCLGPSHSAKACTKKIKCFYCQSDSHNSALCIKQFGSRQNNTGSKATTGMCVQAGQAASSDSNVESLQQNLVSNADNSHSLVYMQMAIVKLDTKRGPYHARICLDPGSTCSYATTKLAKYLGLRSYGRLKVSNARFGESNRQSHSFESAILSIPTRDGDLVPVDVYITDTIAPPLQKLPLDTTRYPLLSQVPLADSVSKHSEFLSIDILIGGDSYFDFVGSEQIRLEGGLMLLGSKLGYITAGKVQTTPSDTQTLVTTMLNFSVVGKRSYNQGMDKFWSLEHIGINEDCYSTDDDLAIQHFSNTVEKIGTRYQVGWPWKNDAAELSTNYPIALQRLRCLSKRLQKDSQLGSEYSKRLHTQEEQGIIERVPEAGEGQVVHYLPHHCVVKQDSATTKLRVVYDASCKANVHAVSLNDCIHRGPILLSDLVGILIRFRLYPVVLISDIEKAFLQLSLRPADRDAVRLLWVEDLKRPVAKDNLVEYRFAPVPFGVVASPFLLAATVRHHLTDQGTDTALMINSNIYVDNLVLGCFSTSEAIERYNEAKQLFSDISMNVCEWESNDEGFMTQLPFKDRATTHSTKVLGVLWDTKTDTIRVKETHPLANLVNTKRKLVESACKTFDPCGLLSPVTIRLKLLVQKVWKLKLGWDDQLPDCVVAEWKTIAGDMESLAGLSVPRYLDQLDCDLDSPWELHTFCDASAVAYAAAIYLRAPNGKTALSFSKTRVAPIKSVTIPRLELLGVTIGVRTTIFVREQLPKHVITNLAGPIIWSDSKCVLHWLQSSKVLPVFVENRVRAIRRAGFECRYVPSDQNPADLPTKGIQVTELQNAELWWAGPRFVQEGRDSWPANRLSPMDEVEDPQSNVLLADQTPRGSMGYAGIEARKFLKLHKLLGVTSYVMRFVGNLKRRIAAAKGRKMNTTASKTQSITLTAQEIQNARLAWTFHCQQQFVELASEQQFKNLQRQLDLFRDSSSLLRCGGRFREAQGLTESSKFPIFLPKHEHSTRLLLEDSHHRIQHLGPSHTLAEFRGIYWTHAERPKQRR